MKNTTKFLGIIILAAAGFCMLACPTGDGDKDKDKDDGSFNLATLKVPEGLKSVYLSDIKVTGGARAAGDSGPGGGTSGPGSDTVSSLSYVSPTGQNAPVLFSTAKKQFVFAVTSLEQLGERCIVITIDGYYEATGTDKIGAYTLGDLIDTSGGYFEENEIWVETQRIGSVLIDMKNNKLYNFTEFKEGNWGSSYPVRFMEGDIIYTIKDDYQFGTSRGTVYKIDLSTASAGSALTAAPLNNATINPINRITLPYTISNKLISGYEWNDIQVMDVSGTKPQKPLKVSFDVNSYSSYNFFSLNSLIRDLRDQPWLLTNGTDEPGWYAIAKVSIDDDGNLTLSDSKTVNVNYYTFDNYSDAQVYTFNAQGIGTAFSNNTNYWETKKMKSYLNYGVVTLYQNRFARLRQEADSIKIETGELTGLPTESIVGKSVISKEDYLFYLQGDSIMRRKLEADSSAATAVYTNPGLLVSATARDIDLLTASGRKLIFYQYAAGSVTEIHTYSLDMYSSNPQPELLATSNVQTRSIVELDF